MRSRMTLSKWYGGSLLIPNLKSRNYPGFVASCFGLVRTIVQRRMDGEVHLTFVNRGTAAADIVNKCIYINRDYLKGMIAGKVVANHQLALTCTLGTIVHECGHFAYTPEDSLKQVMDYIAKHSGCAYHEEIARSVGNVVEDIYIEAELARQVPSLIWMVDTGNDVYFDDKEIEERLDAVKEIENSPDDLMKVSALINMFIMARMLEEVDSNPFVRSLFRDAYGAKELHGFEDRLALTLHIYNRLMQHITPAQCNAAEGGGKATLKADLARALGATAEQISEREATALSSYTSITTDKDTAHVMEAIDKALRMTEEAEVTCRSGGDGREEFSPTQLFVEKPVDYGPQPVEVDRRYAPLAEFARQRAVVNRPYGLDRNKGNHLRKLHRIATDQKIFADPMAVNSYKPMQVLILVDCSFSMHGDRSAPGPYPIERAIQAATGAAYALAEARCDVAVYGHTADVLSDNDLAIYRAKGFNETMAGLSLRMEEMRYLTLQENRDGYAIEYLAEKFTDRRKRRLMIVISDGAPLATSGYNGSPAIRHTTEKIKEVRDKGIDVLSISITEQANRTNKLMYGEKWNVYNQDPNVIEKVVAALLEGKAYAHSAT